MSIKTNTTQTIDRASTVLMDKVEKTMTNMNTLLARAGMRDKALRDARIKVEIPVGESPKDDILYIGFNTVDFYFKRGAFVDMPLPLVEIAANSGKIGKHYLTAVKEKEEEIAKEKAAVKAAKTESTEA